jgi:ABC transport system ATP-binding/permease protein
VSQTPKGIAGPGAALPPWRRQSALLADRYLDVMLGDLPTLLLLLAQAPAIGALCAVVWGGIERDTKSLYFVLALTAVWFGCINACREIVKERPLLERERLFGLSTLAYVVSKARVLVGLDLVQVALLLAIVEWRIGLHGSLLWQAPALLLCAMAGTGLGLLISALTQRQERAVAAVPLLILPQILFSEFAIPRDQFSNVTDVVEKFMIVRWGYQVFVEAAATTPDYVEIALALGVLTLMALVLHAAAATALRWSDPEEFL